MTQIKYYVLIMYLFWMLTGMDLIAQNRPKISKPKFEDMNQVQIAPNTIKVKGLIKNELRSADFCGKTYVATLEIEVLDVIASASGLSYSVSAGQHIQVFLSKALIARQDTIQFEKAKQKPVTFILKEKLCQDMSQVVYENIQLIWGKSE